VAKAVEVSVRDGLGRQSLGVAVLALAMAVAVFPSLALSVLATFLFDDLGITRTQLGIAVASVSAVAAATSIWLGGIADRQGGRLALLAVFVLAALAIGGYAAAPTYLALLGATILGGLCQGVSNPASNRLVIENFPPRRRGLITGIKQAGEMVALVLCGALLPVGALALGWRGALALAALVPVIAIFLLLLVMPAGRGSEHPAAEPRPAEPMSSQVRWLAAHALLMGVSGGAISAYLPLYANESVGLSVIAAGQVVALIGVVAIIGRVLWGHFAGRSESSIDPLIAISVLAAGGAIAMGAASWFGPGMLLAGAIVWGASQLSYGSVSMLAAMNASTHQNAGRASGVVLVGFSLGLMLGPPLFGWSVDLTGTYAPGFVGVVADLGSATTLVLLWRRLDGRLAASRIAPAS
jgi:predicted MFS family arabinose efflux permease